MKRELALVLSFFTSFVFEAVRAEQPPQITSDEYICRYSDKCEKDSGDNVAPIGDTREFSLGSPTGGKPIRAVSASTGQNNKPRTASIRSATRLGVNRNDLLIAFQNGSSELTSQAKANMNSFSQALKSPQLRQKRFEIAGHTNAIGNDVYNLELSRHRAEAVADYLVSQGIDSSRLVVRGYGFSRLLPNTSPKSALNRRVEAVIISN